MLVPQISKSASAVAAERTFLAEPRLKGIPEDLTSQHLKKLKIALDSIPTSRYIPCQLVGTL